MKGGKVKSSHVPSITNEATLTRTRFTFRVLQSMDSNSQATNQTPTALVLTPLPGSSFYTQMLTEGRLLDTAWDTYDAHHVKFIPRGFTPWELQRAQIGAHARFYSPRHVAARLLRGSMGGFFVGVYASALNRRWQRLERDYLRRLRLLFPRAARA